MHRADDCEAVLRLGVPNRVTAREQPAGSTNLAVRGREDPREQLDRELFGERGDRKRKQRRAAHCEHVVQRVRRRDRTVIRRVVDDRRKEIEREDQRALVVETIDRGVVGW
jgi:hypothetical protein